MSSELLRKAAALMRERAEAATPGPWEVLWNAVAHVATVSDPSDPTGQTPMQEPVKVADAGDVDREHIASWHPAVALAVADSIDLAADWVADYPGSRPPWVQRAEDLALAYLGSDQ